MTLPSSIYELREKGKTKEFCLSVKPEEFVEILALLEDKSHTEHDTLEILATIANILLVNRELHQTHFTIHSAKLLNDVLDIAQQGEKRFKKTLQESLPSFEFTRVAVYRLVFLILYEGKQLPKELIIRSRDVLERSFKICDDHFQMFAQNDSFLRTLNEIVKGLLQIIHKFTWLESNVSPHDCIFQMDQLFVKPLETTTERQLAKSLANIYFVIRKDEFSPPKVEPERMEARKICLKHYLIFLKENLEAFSRGDSNVNLTDLMALIATLAVSFRAFRCVYDIPDRTEVVDSFYKAFVNNFLPRENEENYFYRKFYELVVLSKPFSSLSFDYDITVASKLKSLILNWYLSMCTPYPRDNEATIRLFLRCFGWSNSVAFLVSSDIKIPESIDHEEFLQPDPLFLKPEYICQDDLRPNSTESVLENVFHRIQQKQMTESNNSPNHAPMTLEEKEREAEKLFTLLQRAEKNPMLQGFKNPVREWQQSGKFEHIS